MNTVAAKLQKNGGRCMPRPEDYRLEERPMPKLGPGEVLIKVKSTGIRASNIKCYTGAAKRAMRKKSENRRGPGRSRSSFGNRRVRC